MVLHKGKASVKGFFFFCKLVEDQQQQGLGKTSQECIFLFTIYKNITTSPGGEGRQSMLPQIQRIFLFRKRGLLVNLWAMLDGKWLTKTKLWTYVRTLWPWENKKKINRCCVIFSADRSRQCIAWRDFSQCHILSSSELTCKTLANALYKMF